METGDEVVVVGTAVPADVVVGLLVPFFKYSSSRLPAPQYSNWLPGQTKLQSVAAARTEPAFRVLPQ